MTDISGNNKVITKLEAIGFVWEVLASVAIPTTVFALLGRMLDARWNSSPYATLVGFTCSVAIAFVLVIRKAKAMANRLKSGATKV